MNKKVKFSLILGGLIFIIIVFWLNFLIKKYERESISRQTIESIPKKEVSEELPSKAPSKETEVTEIDTQSVTDEKGFLVD